jgi:hypothetical protein
MHAYQAVFTDQGWANLDQVKAFLVVLRVDPG